MNKYLKGFLNSIIQLAIGLIGALFAWNILVAGFLFFPDVITRVDLSMASSSFPIWWTDFVPGMLPTIFVLSTTGLAAFSMFITVRFLKNFDIEKIINAIQKDLKGDKQKVKSE